MTVKYLEALQRKQVAMAAASDPNVANKFRAGFTECAGEVGRFPGLDGPVKRRLLQHLANCLNSANPMSSPPPTQQQQQQQQPPPPPPQPQPCETTNANTSPLQVHILRNPTQSSDTTPVVQQTNSNIILANTSGQGVQLVPTRLPNGDIALILPSSNTFRSPRSSATSSVTPSSSPSPSISSNSSGSSPLPMLVPIPNRSNSNSPPIAIDRLSMNSNTPPRQVTIVTTQNPQRIILPQSHHPGKPAPIVTYQYNEENDKLEHVIQQRVILPDSYLKSERIMKDFDDVPAVMGDAAEPSIINGKRDVMDNLNRFNENCERALSDDEHCLYEGNRIIMTHDGRIIENDHGSGGGYVRDKMYGGQERETLLHIPDREYYDGELRSISPKSPVDYHVETVDDDHKYAEYYQDHYDRSYSPEMPKPLALVTRKKCEEYGNDERPWRPW